MAIPDPNYKKRHDKQKQDSSILDRMNRNDDEDKIEIGQLIQDAMNGKFGTIFVLLINGIIDEELAKSSMNDGVNSDRVLGRIEGLNKLQDRMETCISQKDNLTEAKREENALEGESTGEKELTDGPQPV